MAEGGPFDLPNGRSRGRGAELRKQTAHQIVRSDDDMGGNNDNNAEDNIDLMMNVIKGIRSIRGEYKLTNKQKTEVFLETKSNDVKTVLESTSDFIRCLSSSEKITFSNEIPAGCVISVVNDDVNAHIMLKVCILRAESSAD